MKKILLISSIIMILISCMVLSSDIFIDGFVAGDGTELKTYNSWNENVADGWTISSNRATTGVVSSTADRTFIDSYSISDGINITLTLNASINGNGRILAGICTEQNDGNNYCGLDDAGGVGSDGYFMNIDQSSNSVDIRYFSGDGAGIEQSGNPAIPEYYQIYQLNVYNDSGSVCLEFLINYVRLLNDCSLAVDFTTFNTTGISKANAGGNLYIEQLNVTDTSIILNPSPIITFLNQTPSDINITGLFYENLSIYYNISDDTGISDINFSYKINNSFGNIPIYINGSIQQLGFIQKDTYTNVSDIYKFTLSDNRIYPASYNIDEEVTNIEKKNSLLIDTSNDYAKIEILNLTSQWNYYIAEVYINNSVGSTGSAQIYICNSSYTTGTPFNTADCILGRTITANTPYNHVHSSVSKHYVIPFTKNVITNPKYIVIRGDSNSNFYLNYVTNESRTGVMQISNNAGSSYSNVVGTPDSHIHFYNGTETFCYFVSANDTLDQRTTTPTICDNLDITNLPPTSPIVYSPSNEIYSGNININWTNSTPFFNAFIVGYNVSLYDSNNVFVSHLTTTSSLSYVWDSTSIDSGNYSIRVLAYDNNSLTNFGESEEFEIDNKFPTITDNAPDGLFLNTTSGYILEAFNFDVLFSDDNLYITEFIIQMTNGTTIYNDSVINNPTIESYNLIDSFIFPNVTSLNGYAKAIDGHTDTDIKEILESNVIKETENKIISECFDYELIDDVNKLTLEYQKDRVVYNAEYKDISNKRTIKITPMSCGHGNIIKSDKYKDYLVIGKYWIDFLSDDVINVRITDNGAYYIIEQYFKNDVKNVLTKSIGQVNEYRVDFTIDGKERVYVPITEQSTAGTIFLIFLLLFFFAFIMLAIFMKIPILWILAGGVGIITGIASYNFITNAYNMHFLISMVWVSSGFMLMGLAFLIKRKRY